MAKKWIKKQTSTGRPNNVDNAYGENSPGKDDGINYQSPSQDTRKKWAAEKKKPSASGVMKKMYGKKD